MLSLYLDKSSWFERIAQGKSVGFIIILIGIAGVIFSSYKIYLLNENKKLLEDPNESNVISEMVESIRGGTSYQSKENIIDELISNYSAKLDWGVSWIKFVAAVAPLLGLLGTVIGMIIAFHEMANAGGNIDVELLSKGIYTAMTTTVAGLIVGIIAYIAYNFLVSKVDKVVFMLEAKTTEFLDLLHINE